MIFGFVLKDGSFLPESDALKRIDDRNDNWDRGAQYAARLDGTDQKEVGKILTREGIPSGQIQTFLQNLEPGPLPEIMGMIYFMQDPDLRRDWQERLEKFLVLYDIKALIDTPEGKKTILAYLQEMKSIPAETISQTLHKAPLKTRRLLNRPRKRGRPADILEQTFLKSFCAVLRETWRETFRKAPATHRQAPLNAIARYFLDCTHYALSSSRVAKILHD